MRTFYIDEIDGRYQFDQPFTSSFFARRSQKRKKTVKLSVFIVHLGSACVQGVIKTLMKLTPGISLTNILQAAFAHLENKSTKKDWQPDCLLGTFVIWVCKSFVWNVDEINTWYQFD